MGLDVDRFTRQRLSSYGLWHIVEVMKALKSNLGRAVLADPQAKSQLRDFLAKKTAAGSGAARTSIRVRTGNGQFVDVTPVVVPKAA
ncbi:MAG: hypothetical protein M3082_06235 [Candidatus Dormibacteraeota bacterium]|nr:hypothetical protein [Candidatus Dormibacteraeota bacterium]